MSEEPRIKVTRGRDGSIRIDPDSLYQSPAVLQQLDAARRLARSLALAPRQRPPTASPTVVDALHECVARLEAHKNPDDAPTLIAAYEALKNAYTELSYDAVETFRRNLLRRHLVKIDHDTAAHYLQEALLQQLRSSSDDER